MKKETIIAIVLLTFVFLINYSLIDAWLVKEFSSGDSVNVTRVIDGDTVKAGNLTIRFLGINTPEKGEKYYSEAKEFLEKEILGEVVELEYGKDKTDLYGRTLAYVYLDGGNINLKLVENGLANFYFPSGKDVHYNDFYSAWENCEDYLCEKSEDKCGNCVKIKSINYNSQEIVLENICSFDCDLNSWTIKDEGRKNFEFPDYIIYKKSEVIINKENFEETYVWTETGDSAFLRDSEGFLVDWESY